MRLTWFKFGVLSTLISTVVSFLYMLIGLQFYYTTGEVFLGVSIIYMQTLTIMLVYGLSRWDLG